jgi:hypothetical protein
MKIHLKHPAYQSLTFCARSISGKAAVPNDVIATSAHCSVCIMRRRTWKKRNPPNAKADGSRSDPVQRPVEPAAQSGEKDNSK